MSQPSKSLMPAEPVPSGSIRVKDISFLTGQEVDPLSTSPPLCGQVEEPSIIIEFIDQSSPSQLHVWTQNATTLIDTPRSSSSARPVTKKSRRSLSHVRANQNIANVLTNPDSGSDMDIDDSGEEDEGNAKPSNTRLVARRLRDLDIIRLERQSDAVRDEVILAADEGLEHSEQLHTNSETAGSTMLHPGTASEGNEAEVDGNAAGPENLYAFSWSEDFSTFSGQEEMYLKSPGPNVSFTDNVADLFMFVWDIAIVQKIVIETNKYAWQTICKLSENDRLTNSLDKWEETTVEEIYRLFAILIYMSICHRGRVDEYWTKGILQMSEFRCIMSRNRFSMLMRFLHFVDNDDLLVRSYDRKISKIAPIFQHCNNKFGSMYTPQKELSLDESLLLWKGRLPWVQRIRTKAARIGIKTYELCEAESGYTLRSLLYAGKNSSMFEETIHAFENSTAKVVLELMDGYLDIGHLLVMDNWYNQLPLSRFLKRRRTDVIGTLNRRRLHVPPANKALVESNMSRGDQIAQHCGDLTVISWKDLKLVTAVSTYHNAEQVEGRRKGVLINKPRLIATYNQFMGGVDLKDQKLSMFLLERKRGMKWYIKVFKRLLNESLLNTYIVYTKNPLIKLLTHRQYRYKVAEGLLERFQKVQVGRPLALHSGPTDQVRLDGLGGHFPVYTAETTNRKNRHTRRRCTRCSMKGQRTQVTTMCSKCDVPLCLAQCWVEYHTLKNLGRSRKLRRFFNC